MPGVQDAGQMLSGYTRNERRMQSLLTPSEPGSLKPRSRPCRGVVACGFICDVPEIAVQWTPADHVLGAAGCVGGVWRTVPG